MTGTWIFYKKEEILFRFNPVTSFKTGILNTWIFSMDERSLPQDEAVVVLIQIRRRGSESAIFFSGGPGSWKVCRQIPGETCLYFLKMR